MEKKDFLEKYGIDENDLSNAGLDWEELMAIREDHLNNRYKLAAAAIYVAERLNSIEQVHSVKTTNIVPTFLPSRPSRAISTASKRTFSRVERLTLRS